MIILILKLIFICSILVLGATIVSQETMLLYSIREWAEKKNSSIYEALILCHWCMPSIWSIVAILISYGIDIIPFFDYRIFFVYLLTVCGSSIVCGFTWSLYLLTAEKIKYYSNRNGIEDYDVLDEIEYLKQFEN